MVLLRSLVESRSGNAAVVWALLLAFAAGAVVSLAAGDPLWALYAVAVLAVALAPAALARDRRLFVAWPVLALAALPLVVHWASPFERVMAYAAVATLSLLVAVEVDAFSTASMPPWFAVSFVAMTTLTVAALWGVVQYFSDVALGTTYLPGRAALMWDLVVATAVGVGAGVVFEVFLHEYEAVADAADGVTEG